MWFELVQNCLSVSRLHGPLTVVELSNAEVMVIQTLVIALQSDVGVDVKSDKIEFFDSFSLVEREL